MENENLVLSRLDMLSREIMMIKEQLADLVLTNEDIEALDKAEIDLKEGNTKRLN